MFGWEITQGLVEYELVAGKATLARVFVGFQEPRVQLFAPAELGGVSLPAGFHFDEPWGGVLRLDYASLEVTHIPTGARFEVPATVSGEFSIPGLTEDDNVNFYIDGRSLWRTGEYGFVARFYRDGSLVGTNSLGKRRFLETADFRLLIKVNRIRPLTPRGTRYSGRLSLCSETCQYVPASRPWTATYLLACGFSLTPFPMTLVGATTTNGPPHTPLWMPSTRGRNSLGCRTVLTSS